MRTMLFAALAASLAVSPAQAKKYPPSDECVSDASFVAFRKALVDIVKRKDAKALLAVTSPTIEFDLGGPSTRTGFATEYKLDKPASSPLWAELDGALSHGCSLADGEASAPYWYKHGPDGDIADIALIGGERVNVRATPSRTAKVLRTVDWESAAVTDESNEGWIKVKFDDATEGWVARPFVWTGYSIRAIFTKRDGKWLMTAFVAGD